MPWSCSVSHSHVRLRQGPLPPGHFLAHQVCPAPLCQWIGTKGAELSLGPSEPKVGPAPPGAEWGVVTAPRFGGAGLSGVAWLQAAKGQWAKGKHGEGVLRPHVPMQPTGLSLGKNWAQADVPLGQGSGSPCVRCCTHAHARLDAHSCCLPSSIPTFSPPLFQFGSGAPFSPLSGQDSSEGPDPSATPMGQPWRAAPMGSGPLSRALP